MLFKDISIVDPNFEIQKNMYVGTLGEKIAYVGRTCPKEDFGEIYDGKNKVLLPGLVNAHTHSPMTLLRGYAENLPLDRWLNEKVFPFEDRLNDDRAYFGTMLSVAEMLSSGTTSFSDMYFFQDGVLRAVKDSRAKINFSRSIVSFEDVDFLEDGRVCEALEAVQKYHNTENGRIKIDMALHAEYTNVLSMIEQFGAYTKGKGLVNHIHVSETKAEHENCKKKYGKTPTQVFCDAGVLDSPAIFAHCVWIEESDIRILKNKGVTVAHCPASNLKLGSGVCNVNALLESGVNVAIGTDSAASNNGLDMFREMYLAALLPKGISGKADIVSPKEIIKMATLGGAQAQGRFDTGIIKEGFRADLTVIDTDKPGLYPDFDILSNIVYSAEKSDVILTMVDGEVLYKNGEFTTIDVEKIGFEVNRIVKEVVSEVKNG